MATDDPLAVKPGLSIPTSELTWRFGPSGGPGGQHANTSNTRAELVFEIADSPTLNHHQRDKLERAFGPRIRVVVDDTRSQTRNRELALARLAERMNEALRPERIRRPTKPGRGAKERRLKQKRQRGERKSQRRAHWDD